MNEPRISEADVARYKDVRRYDAGSFHGSARSYAGQGQCSLCSGSRPAEYQGKRGAVLIAMCGTCLAQRDYSSYMDQRMLAEVRQRAEARELYVAGTGRSVED